MKLNQKNKPSNAIVPAWKMARLCLMLTAALWASGCANKASLAENDAPGVYSLITVDGAPVPATVSHDGTAIEVRSGTFTINADGTCASKVVFVPPGHAESSREVKATYTREGAKLNMKWQGAGRTVGKIEGDTFTMNNEGMLFVYRK